MVSQIAGCSLVPLIHNGPSRDLQDQLVYIMWHNWHSKVREAAARALGRAGKGEVIHDEIQRKLTDMENEDFRLDALHKIRELKPPLSLLVPGLLSCLEDSVISVRLKCIQLVGEMQIRDDRVRSTTFTITGIEIRLYSTISLLKVFFQKSKPVILQRRRQGAFLSRDIF